MKLSVFLFAMMLSTALWAANDPSIKGELRDNIQSSMKHYIHSQTVEGVILVYDAVQGKMLKLKLDKLHTGIVHKNGFYVSCADFTDQKNRKIDIDFLVVKKADMLITTQAIVHSINGKKRKYHLETI